MSALTICVNRGASRSTSAFIETYSSLHECIGLNSTADSETVSVRGKGAIEEAQLCREGVRALRVSSPHYLVST